MSLHHFRPAADALSRARPLSTDSRQRLHDILWGRPIFKAPQLPDPPVLPPPALFPTNGSLPDAELGGGGTGAARLTA